MPNYSLPIVLCCQFGLWLIHRARSIVDHRPAESSKLLSKYRTAVPDSVSICLSLELPRFAYRQRIRSTQDTASFFAPAMVYTGHLGINYSFVSMSTAASDIVSHSPHETPVVPGHTIYYINRTSRHCTRERITHRKTSTEDCELNMQPDPRYSY